VSGTVIVSEGEMYPHVMDREDLERGIMIVIESGTGTVLPEGVGVAGATGGGRGEAQVPMGLATGDWWRGWDYSSPSPARRLRGSVPVGPRDRVCAQRWFHCAGCVTIVMSGS
jgi:hypothetical protein